MLKIAQLTLESLFWVLRHGATFYDFAFLIQKKRKEELKKHKNLAKMNLNFFLYH